MRTARVSRVKLREVIYNQLSLLAGCLSGVVPFDLGSFTHLLHMSTILTAIWQFSESGLYIYLIYILFVNLETS